MFMERCKECGSAATDHRHVDGRPHVICRMCHHLTEVDPRPTVVTLCGSTRFYDQFQKANFSETMAGRIVLSVGFYPHGKANETAHGESVGITPEQKEKLDVLHKQKIDMSDEILVLNVGGYIGDSTKSEIRHAVAAGKTVRWLEPDKAWKPD